MKEKLILIGNGFDISCGIKSGYADFLEYLKDKEGLTDEELNKYNSLYVRSEKGIYYDWKDVEQRYKQLIEAVNTMDLDNNDIQKINYVEKLNRDLTNFSNSLKDYLKEEVRRHKFREKKSEFINNLLEKSEIDIICYNYTDTIDEIITKVEFENKRPEIYNIHGSLKSDNIIVGHNINSIDNKELVKGSQINNKEIRRDNDFIKKIGDKYDEVHIIGCSIIGTDYDDIIKYMEKATTVYIYDYKGDSDEKVEYIKNKQNNDTGIIEKIKVVLYPEIFIDEEQELSEEDEIFLRKACNINITEIDGVWVPKTLNYFIEVLEINKIHIKINELDEPKYQLLKNIIDEISKTKGVEGDLTLTIESEVDIDEKESNIVNGRIKEILSASSYKEIIVKNMQLEKDVFKEFCSVNVKKLFIDNIIVTTDDYKNLVNEKIELNTSIETVEFNNIFGNEDVSKVNIIVKNSAIKSIKFYEIEGMNIEIINSSKITSLIIENNNEVSTTKVSLQGNFTALKNIEIKTNVLNLDARLNNKIIEKIDIQADNYSALEIFDSFDKELYFDKLNKMNLLFKNITDELKIKTIVFATGKKAVVDINDEEDRIRFKESGQVFNVKIEESVVNNQEEVARIDEENIRNESDIKISITRKDMTKDDEDKCIQYAEENDIDANRFIELAREQFEGNIKMSQADRYDELKQLDFKDRRQFREDAFKFVDNLMDEKENEVI